MSKKHVKGLTFSTPVVASSLRREAGADRFVGANGEINAGGKSDLLKQTAAFLAMVANTGAVTEEVAASAEAQANARREMMTAAYTDKAAHKQLGEVMADELYLAANREGFARRFMAKQTLGQGQVPRVYMRNKNLTAAVGTGAVQTHTQIVRDNLYTPPEFYIQGRPFVEQKDIVTATGDVLEEKFVEATEALGVQEDRTWKSLALQMVGVDNDPVTFFGTMTAGGLMALRNQVSRWNLPVEYWLVANDIWNDIVGDASFQAVIDPVSKHELLLTGQLGVIYGMTVISDAYRHPQHRVLSQGEMFCIASPVNHGMMTDRGGIESSPIDVSIEGIPGRGWHMVEMVSMVIANSRSVVRGLRV
jgi:hypothetical protein